MIADNTFGLEGFELVESSEQGMLAQVAAPARRSEAIVFLGWEPHPMNANFKMTYLTGGDDVFGPNFGGADGAHADPRRPRRRMPEPRQVAREPRVHASDGERGDGRDPRRRQGADVAAATEWLQAEPGAARRLAGRRHHLDGADGLAAVKAHLGLGGAAGA